MEDQATSTGKARAESELSIPATAVSRGIGIGHAVFLVGDQSAAHPSAINLAQVDDEIERFSFALCHAADELKNLIGSENLSASAREIFGVHLLILEGSSFTTNIESTIRNNLLNADRAVRQVAEEFAQRQKSAADEHIRDKYLDVQDVANRLQRALGRRPGEENNGSGAVLIVSELMPSRLIELAKSGPTAIISDHGGWTSHASILARELNLPVVTGVRNIEQIVSAGDRLIVDGVDGQVIIRPTEKTIERYSNVSNSRSQKVFSGIATDKPATTTDGLEITIRANADLSHPTQTGEGAGANGIGLYRSEALLSQFHGFPTEADQITAYRQMADMTGDFGVRIRTFDVSVEQVDRRRKEHNPSLGLRSIRLSLTDSVQFRTQIRAILRAAFQRKIDIVLPMISGVAEVLRSREIIDEELANLRTAGIAVGEPRIGAMIEVPSAVLTADEIARHVDFFCLGTNDLVQYLLAVDRDNETVADWYETLHPAVIRAIGAVIAAGDRAGLPVAVCGETAGSAFYVPLLIGLGARELSMNVNSIAQIRRLIGGITTSDAVQLVESLKALETAAEIEDALRNHYLQNWAHLFPAGLLSSKYPQ